MARNARLLAALTIALFVSTGLAAGAALPEDALLVEHWDGSAWTETAAQQPPGGSTLSAATAFSSTDVWAVGSSVKTIQGELRWHPLAEHYDGASWSPMLLPTPNRKMASDLAAVSGSSATDIWAVGVHVGPIRHGAPNLHPLVEHFDGTAWTVVPSVDTAGLFLAGAAAVSRRNAWAVGSQWGTRLGTTRMLVEHWNGRAWRNIPTPWVAEQEELLAVTAWSRYNIWAVGDYQSQRRAHPLLLHWNGHRWRWFTGPVLPQQARLWGVTAAGADDVWAVGAEGSQPLAEHWNGRKWHVVAIPSPEGSSPTSLSAVAAVSPTDVWAVGTTGSPAQTLAEHWDGSSWTIVPTTDRPGNPDVLAGIAAVAAGDVWAVGSANAAP